MQLKWHADDGDCRHGESSSLWASAGLARPVSPGERSTLNFLQLLSATALTATRGFVDAIAGTSAAGFWIRAKHSPDCRPRPKIRGPVAAARTKPARPV